MLGSGGFRQARIVEPFPDFDGDDGSAVWMQRIDQHVVLVRHDDRWGDWGLSPVIRWLLLLDACGRYTRTTLYHPERSSHRITGERPQSPHLSSKSESMLNALPAFA